MNLTVTKIFTFEAAHQLPKHEGKCKYLHGHSYRLEVTVSSDSLIREGPSSGMLVDFQDLKELVVREVVGLIDHSFITTTVRSVDEGKVFILNQKYQETTVECIASDIFSRLDPLLYKDIQLVRIKLWETATSYAEVTR